jgi:hypothetical protein
MRRYGAPFLRPTARCSSVLEFRGHASLASNLLKQRCSDQVISAHPVVRSLRKQRRKGEYIPRSAERVHACTRARASVCVRTGAQVPMAASMRARRKIGPPESDVGTGWGYTNERSFEQRERIQSYTPRPEQSVEIRSLSSARGTVTGEARAANRYR